MNWSFDILRQGGWDWWVAICALGSAVLVCYAVAGRVWKQAIGWVAIPMILIGVAGTVLIIITPVLHSPWVGLVWTFILIALLSATFYLNLHSQLGTRRMAVLLAMRLVAVAMLVPMLFEPVMRYVDKPRPERPILFIVDTSASMSFPDIQNGPTRLASVWQTLRPALPKVKDHFLPRYFVFSTDVEELKKPEELAKKSADGKATDIVKGVSKAVGKDIRTDAAIILISDGIDNVSADVAEKLRAIGRPIHTVRVGSDQAEPAAMANVAVDNVETAEEFVVEHESKVRVTIKSSALANRVVEVKLSEVDESGKPVGKTAKQTLVLQPKPEGQVVEMAFKPKKVGVQKLAAWVDPIAGERSIVDNRQEFQGLALDPRIKVLYIEGRVRPEYTQLNRAMQRDPNIEVASLLRITQEKFTAGGTVNGEKFEQMPASKEQWARFDVVILGDLDISFLNQFQQMAIEQFTSAGGGLLMIGGQRSFGPGGYGGTVIEKALPVFVGDVSSAQEKTQFVPKLSADGLTHPAMEGLADWFGGGAPDAKKELPPLLGNVVVGKLKGGASVLLTHEGRPGADGQAQTVLAVQRYGEGRSAAFTGDTTYRWYLPLRGLGQDSPYNRFWGQLLRWLARADTKNRSRGAGIDGLLNKNLYQLGESVRVRAMVRDLRGDATQFAQVNLKMRRADGSQAQQFPLTAVGSRTGLYEVMIPNPDKGDWVIEMNASKEGKELGKQELKFTVIPPAEELLKLAANPALLAGIAQQTNGFNYELAQLPNLIDQLIRTGAPEAESRQETVPLSNTLRALLAWTWRNPDWPSRYDLPMQAFLVIGILGVEWMLRRRWQLA